jgi:hypothetical protein
LLVGERAALLAHARGCSATPVAVAVLGSTGECVCALLRNRPLRLEFVCHERPPSHEVGLLTRSRFSSAELVITERLERAIAAAAMIGLRSPAAATGTAAAL